MSTEAGGREAATRHPSVVDGAILAGQGSRDRLDRLAAAVVTALDLADELELRDIGIALETARLALEERGVAVAAPRRPPYAAADLE